VGVSVGRRVAVGRIEAVIEGAAGNVGEDGSFVEKVHPNNNTNVNRRKNFRLAIIHCSPLLFLFLRFHVK